MWHIQGQPGLHETCVRNKNWKDKRKEGEGREGKERGEGWEEGTYDRKIKAQIMATQQLTSAALSRAPGPGLLLTAAHSSVQILFRTFHSQVEKHESLICYKLPKAPSWTLVFTTWNVFHSAPSGHRDGLRKGREQKSPQRPTNKEQSSLCVLELWGNKGQMCRALLSPLWAPDTSLVLDLLPIAVLRDDVALSSALPPPKQPRGCLEWRAQSLSTSHISLALPGLLTFAKPAL